MGIYVAYVINVKWGIDFYNFNGDKNKSKSDESKSKGKKSKGLGEITGKDLIDKTYEKWTYNKEAN